MKSDLMQDEMFLKPVRDDDDNWREKKKRERWRKGSVAFVATSPVLSLCSPNWTAAAAVGLAGPAGWGEERRRKRERSRLLLLLL